jgi:hypothetical protein
MTETERILEYDDTYPSDTHEMWGFTCCGTAFGYASKQERDWGIERHVVKHDIDRWRLVWPSVGVESST